MSHLDTQQKVLLRNALLARRGQSAADLEAELRRLGLTAQADRTREAHDAGDEAVADLLASLDSELAQRHAAALEATAAALARVDTAAFGICVDCAAPIGYPRLAAEPTATRCLACQAQCERGQTPPATL